MERMNIHFIIDLEGAIRLFDIEKCLTLQEQKPKTEVKST